MSFVRSSKYRHVFGTAYKKDQCYDNIRVSKNNWDGAFCAVNSKFIAIITESAGGGSFLVLKHEETGRVDLNHAQVVGHKAAVLDLAWNPFNDNIIASGSDDLSVKIWHIPDEGIVDEPLVDPIVDLQYHQKRVGQVLWHPTASNILLSIGHDNVIAIWNAEQGAVVTEITCHPDLVFSASWNHDGSLLATSCKDKTLRIIDPRTGEVKSEGKGHEGAKVQRVQFLKNNKLFTTGFSRMSERQYAFFDTTNMNKLVMETIDNNNAPLTIHYDPDINLIYLIGKGDSLFRYYEISDEKPWVFWLNNYSSNVPQRCCGFIPKRACNVNSCEIARIYKIIQKGTCEPISMVVPRKSDLFQDDIFPDTAGDEPSLTADEWLSGKNKDPILISLAEGYKSTRARSEVKTQGGAAKPNLLANLSKKSSAASTSTAAAPKSSPAAAATNGTTTPTSQPSRRLSDSSPPKVDDKPEPVTAKPKPEPVMAIPKPEPDMAKPKPEPLTAKPKVENRQEDDDGVVELKGALSDLTSTVEKHEARIAALEELNHGQNKELSELKAEVNKLRELVKKQDERIAALEKKIAN